MSVHALFEEVLTRSARVPAGWDTDDFGAGIVDAEAVLNRSLDGPVALAPEGGPARGAAETIGLLNEAWGPGEASTFADVASRPQFQLELSSLVFEDARTGLGPSGAPTPRRRCPVRGSVRSSRRPSVRVPQRRRPGLSPRPSPPCAPTALPHRTRSCSSPPGTARSKQQPTSVPRPLVSRSAPTPRSGWARSRHGSRAPDPSPPGWSARCGRPVQDQLLHDSEVVLERLREGASIPEDPGSRTALEALVRLDGRPALRLSDDGVDLNDPELGEWQGAVVLHPTFGKTQRSVGRIDLRPGVHAGTGFVIGAGLVMTNRHVLEVLGFPTPSRQSPATWILGGEPVINFSPSGTDPTRAFRILEVVFSGPDPIEQRVDLAHLDLALLRVEETNAEGAALPSALMLSEEPIAIGAAKIFVVGYPALPRVLPSDEDGRSRMDVVERLRKIFGMDYGVRYLSPGLVMTAPSTLEDSPRQWVFTHDATSLGGNSGSCVLSFDHDLDIAGLHFAGDWLGPTMPTRWTRSCPRSRGLSREPRGRRPGTRSARLPGPRLTDHADAKRLRACVRRGSGGRADQPPVHRRQCRSNQRPGCLRTRAAAGQRGGLVHPARRAAHPRRLPSPTNRPLSPNCRP